MNQSLFPDDWAQPSNINDLAVDPKKVNELKTWLIKFKNKCGILLLTGPTGCGKSATVRCLAKSLGFHVREWVTPLDRDISNDGDFPLPESQVKKFEDFLQTCSRYQSLFSNIIDTSSLLLVEDYPNTFLRNSEAFHEILERYCSRARSPIVFICSEVADKDLRLASDLFPAKIQLKLGISQLSLNAVIRTKMVSAVKRMGTILPKLDPSFKPPTLDIITEICDNANGDVRYATLLLQIKPQNNTAALFERAMKPKHQKTKSLKSQTREDAVVASCEKDDRVGLLHGVGRVLYPKWQSSHSKLNQNSKRKKVGEPVLNATVQGAKLIHDPTSLVDSFLSTANVFLMFVHENYLNTFSSIDSVASAASCLSLAEIIMTGESYEICNEVSLDVGIRGMMIYNHTPARAWNPVKTPKHFHIQQTQKEIFCLADALFQNYPINFTTLMIDYIPYMSHFRHLNLSHDQRQFISSCSSMQSLTNFRESFRSSSHGSQSKEKSNASYLIGHEPKKLDVSHDEELHISEDDSDVELDEGSQNLSMLEAALCEEQRQDQDFQHLLDDSEADIFLSQL